MRRITAPIVLAGLAGAGLVAALGIGLPAGAQEDAPSDRVMDGPVADALDGLVADGTLTQAQADAVLEAVGAEFEAQFDDRHPFDELLVTAAEALGLTTDELQEAVSDGSSLADVAEEQDVERQVLVDALLADARAALEARDVPEEMRAEIEEGLPGFIERVVDGELAPFGAFHHGPGAHHGWDGGPVPGGWGGGGPGGWEDGPGGS